MTVDGNKVSSVHNDVSGSTSVYSYDTNGRMVSDSARGVLSVGYNSLSLPERVEFAEGAITSYVYDAEGRKLRTMFQTQDRTVTTDYCGGLLFENDVPTMLLTETRHGIGWYDFGARRYDHDVARWTTMDPLSEKYYSVSPLTPNIFLTDMIQCYY